MRTLAITLAAAAALLGAAPAARANVRAHARVVTCTHASTTQPGSAVFEGRMSSLAGASRLRMRFTLQVRHPGAVRWSHVAAPSFDRWRTSMSGVARYVYTKHVQGLLAPGAYRVQIRFRWIDRYGRTVAVALRRSAPCRQPDPRPNLVLRHLLVQPGLDAAHAHYVAVVANTGRSAAGPFSVAFAVRGAPAGSAAAAGLAPGATLHVGLDGPPCAPGDPVSALADANGAVDERTRADDGLTVACA